MIAVNCKVIWRFKKKKIRYQE